VNEYGCKSNYKKRESKRKKHLFLLFFSHLFVPLASPKVLSFGKAKEKKTSFSFVFLSLIRTFVAQ